MKTESIFAVYETSGNYDGSPKVIEVFTSREQADKFADGEKEKRKEAWIHGEREKWRKKNLRKRNAENMLSQEEIDERVGKFIKTIDEAIHFTIKVDTLDKVIEKIRDEIHEVYSSMDESY